MAAANVSFYNCDFHSKVLKALVQPTLNSVYDALSFPECIHFGL